MRKSRLRKAVPGTGSPRLPLWILVIVVCAAVIPAFSGQRETVATETILLPHLRQPVEPYRALGHAAHLREERG